MKKQALFAVLIVCLTIIFPSISTLAIDYPEASSAIADKPAIDKSTDSLAIFHLPNGRYYIYCSICPIQEANGFLQVKILDTLNFIDSDIPEEAWIKAYVAGAYTYRWQPKKSSIKFEDHQFRVDNCWDGTRAILVGDSIKSLTLTNVTRNDVIDSVHFGKFMLIAFFIFGLVIGVSITAMKIRYITITYAAIIALIGFFLYVMFNGTLIAFTILLAYFIVGNLVSLSALVLIAYIRRKKAKKNKLGLK